MLLQLPRRFRTDSGDWRSTSHQEILFGALSISDEVKLQRLRLVTHLLRHDTPYKFVFSYLTAQERAPRTLSYKRAASDLRVDEDLLVDLAQDRRRARYYIDSLRSELVGLRTVTLHWDSTWEATVKRAKGDPYELQFVEEHTAPHLTLERSFVHAYTDGSRIRYGDRYYTGIGCSYLNAPRNHWAPAEVSQPLNEASEEHAASNNRAELLAFMRSLIDLHGLPLIVHTDSYVAWEWFHHLRNRHRATSYKQLAKFTV